MESTSVPAELAPGAESAAWVRWRFLREPDEACLPQLAVLDGTGRTVLSREEELYPVDIWRKGDHRALLGVSFYQRFPLAVPTTAPPGEYAVTLRLVSVVGRRPLSQPVRLADLAVGERS